MVPSVTIILETLNGIGALAGSGVVVFLALATRLVRLFLAVRGL